jgi:transcription elongation GreA/GreB family factor
VSRAYVNEDAHIDALPDRPVSEHPNLVTSEGLALIEAALEDERRAYAEAQAAGDRDQLASAGDASCAIGTPAAPRPSSARWSRRPMSCSLGHTVTIERDHGHRQTFRIVGEDEADPAKGSISYVSPLARGLLGRRAGDVVRAGKDDAEIVAIKWCGA